MSFDLLAPHYHWMERLLAGGKMQRCRTVFLKEALKANRILLVGEGHGRFIEALGKQHSKAMITYIDSSIGMLEEARAVAKKYNIDDEQLQFIHSDIRKWEVPVHSYDLIVTHFFLDCFPEDQLDEVVGKLSVAASESALWHLADFTSPATAGWKRIRAICILKLMYLFFRLVTKLPAKHLVAPDELLAKYGFVLKERCDMEWGLMQSALWTKRVV